ncbi:hypothetical protein ABT173_06130 [Streptomyces sp. NPDC001795]|uniref:hypothetical protein n=1 Tax=unclassified Streptomyces TaxID=2593676 RepID=UPI003330842C
MTQSGQGEGPSARPAHEGIVLPSDGGEPLLPGRTAGANGSTVPAGGRGTPPSDAPDGQAAPAGGQAWGQPWGPGQSAEISPHTQTWGADAGQSWGAPEQPGTQPSWDPALQQPQTAPGQPLPPEGAQASSYGMDGQHAPQGAQGVQQGAHPLPHTLHSAPLPPADEGATQYIPPVTAAPDEGATQYIPPVPAGADEGATQYIPPVGPGALPPEMPADDATRFLGRMNAPAAGALPPAAHPDAQATQYLPPVPGQPGPAPYGARQTPAEFDNLFRHDAGGAPATQHLPRFDAAGAPGAPGAPMGPAAGGYDDNGGGRTRSRVPLIAAVGVGIVVLGIGAGALLSGGNGTDGKTDNSKNVSATGPATDSSASGTDAAKAQAVALDKLLADSGNSRGSVIRAVADVKACQNLDQAGNDLRDAAKQRNDLVTRLSGLAVDKLPDHDALTAALTNAWKASAAADTHYAAWADQVSGGKGCKKGQARTTGQTEAGNRASGTASAQKLKASQLWNAIAQKYGLAQRQPTQL